ncbi:hypothetical protein EV360DRAFT_83416 [Lentinula raphanica]|nr:hypothetical protein EV360DRAFT_83416 [Lentinula raphanica]
MPMVSLPAGFYEIHFHTYSDGTRKVLTPESVGVAIITGNLPKDAIWQMQADGRIVAFSKSGNQVQQYQTLTKNKPCQPGDSVTTSNEENSGMPWLICNVEYHLLGNYWTGDIIANDGTKLSWSVDSADSSIRLRQVDDLCISSMPKFEFRPITSRDGQGRDLIDLQRLLSKAVFFSHDAANARLNEVQSSFSTSFVLPAKCENALVNSGRQQLDTMVRNEFGDLSIVDVDDTVSAILTIMRTSVFHQNMFGHQVQGNALGKFIMTGNLLDIYCGYHFYPRVEAGSDMARANTFIQTACFTPIKQALQNYLVSGDLLQDEHLQIPSKRSFAQVSGSLKVYPRKKQELDVEEGSCSPSFSYLLILNSICYSVTEIVNPTSRQLQKRNLTPSPRKKRPEAPAQALEPAKDNSHVEVKVQDLQDQFVNVLPKISDTPELMFMDVDVPLINEDLAIPESPQLETSTLLWTVSEHEDLSESRLRDYDFVGSLQASEEIQLPKDDNLEKVSLNVEACQDIDEIPDENSRLIHTEMVEQSNVHSPSSSTPDKPSVSLIASTVPSVLLPTKTLLHSQGLTLSTNLIPRQASLTPRLPTNVYLPSDSYLAAQGPPLASRIAPPTLPSPLIEAGHDSEPSAQVTACTPSSKTKSTSFKTRFLSFVTRTLRFIVATFAVYCLFLIFSSWQERLNLQLHVLLFIKALAIVYTLVSTIVEFFYTKQSLSYSLLKSCMVTILSTTFAIESLLLVYAIIDILTQKDAFAFVIPSRLKIGHKYLHILT